MSHRKRARQDAEFFKFLRSCGVSEGLEGLKGRASDTDFTQYATFLHAARVLYRAHPELIKAPEMAQPYLSAYQEEYGAGPETEGDCAQYGCPCFKGLPRTNLGAVQGNRSGGSK